VPYNYTIFQNRANKREIEGTETSHGREKARLGPFKYCMGTFFLQNKRFLSVGEVQTRKLGNLYILVGTNNSME